MDVKNEDGSITRNKGTPQETTEYPERGNLNVIVDNSELEKELLDTKLENEQLKGDLSLLAQKQLDAKARAIGLDSLLSNEEKINRIRDFELKHEMTSPLNAQQLGLPQSYNEGRTVENREYDSIEEMISGLQKTARDENDDESKGANVILDKLAVKGVRQKNRELLDFEIDPRDVKTMREKEKKEIGKRRMKP